MLGAQQVASVYGVIGADLSPLNSGLREARSKLAGFGGAFKSAGDTIASVGRKMTLGLTVPLVGLGVKMVREAADFEAATNILGVAARNSGTGLEELRQAALAVGADTQLVGIDAMEAAEAMTNFYKAGLATSDVFGDLNGYLREGTNLTGALRASVDLAAASDLDLASASEVVAIAMKTYGMNADQATAIADSFVGAADASVAEVSDLTEGMASFGPVANQFGWSLADTNTALAILSERGIRGAEAGTGLRSMMTNMMRDTKEVNETLEELNLNLYDEQGAMRDLPDIMGELTAKLGNLTEQQRNQVIQTLAGTYGMRAMATLVAEGAEGWDEMEESIAASATAQEVGTERTKGFSGALENLQGSLQTFLIEAGGPFLETFATPAIEKLSAFVGGLNELPPETVANWINLAGALAIGGPLMLGLGKLMGFAGAHPILTALGLALAVVGAALFLESETGKPLKDALVELSETEPGLRTLLDVLEGINTAVGKIRGFVTGEGKPEPSLTRYGKPAYPQALGPPTVAFPPGATAALVVTAKATFDEMQVRSIGRLIARLLGIEIGREIFSQRFLEELQSQGAR